MKLATYHDGSRDGQLVVVSRDLTQAHYAGTVATRLQQVLDDWNFLSPQLETLSAALNQGRARHAFGFEPQKCMAPLPRAYQWAAAAAYPSHVERLWRMRGAALPDRLHAEPLLVQGSGDAFLGPCDDARFGSEDDAIDFEAGLAVITADLPAGASPVRALEAIRLVVVANAWCLRRLLDAEAERGFGGVQGRTAVAFSPVALTPDELGPAWAGGRSELRLQSTRNGRRLGAVDTGAPMRFHFGELVAHLARTRPVRAGTIVGAGPVSHADVAQGFNCIAEQRAIEAQEGGAALTPYLQFGDTIRVEALRADAGTPFGPIEQRVVGPQSPP
jgi:fumarylacetoacetate (FAA) hydrolase